MKQTIRMLVERLGEQEFREDAAACLAQIQKLNQSALAHEITALIEEDTSPIRFANLVHLLQPAAITAQFAAKILHKITPLLAVSSPLRLQLGLNQQAQDQALIQFLSQQLNVQAVAALHVLAQQQPEVFYCYLLYYWPDELRPPQQRVAVPSSFPDQLLRGGAVESLTDPKLFTAEQLVNAALRAEPQPTFLHSNQTAIVPSSVLIHLLGCAITKKTAPLIFPLLLTALSYQITAQATSQLLVFLNHCLSLISDPLDMLQKNAVLVLHSCGQLLQLHNGGNSVVKLMSHALLFSVIQYLDPIDLAPFYSQLVVQTQKSLDMSNQGQIVQQFVSDLKPLYSVSPLMQFLLGSDVVYQIWGDQTVSQTQRYAYNFAAQIAFNATQLIRQSNISQTIQTQEKKTIRSPIGQPVLIEQYSLQVGQLKSYAATAVNQFVQLLSSPVAKQLGALRQQLLNLLAEILAYNPQYITALINQSMSQKLKLSYAQLCQELLATLKPAGFRNATPFVASVIQFIIDVAHSELKFQACTGMVQFAQHEMAYYQKDLATKAMFEPYITELVTLLLENNLVAMQSDQFMTLLSIVVEAFCNMISQKETGTEEIIQRLIKAGFKLQLYTLVSLVFKNKLLKPGLAEQQGLQTVAYLNTYRCIVLLQIVGETLSSDERLSILLGQRILFSDVLSLSLALITAPNNNAISPVLRFLEQVAEPLKGERAVENVNTFFQCEEADPSIQIGAFAQTEKPMLQSLYIQQTLHELAKNLATINPGTSFKQNKLRSVPELLPGYPWRTYQPVLCLEHNLQRVNALIQQEPEDDGEDSRSEFSTGLSNTTGSTFSMFSDMSSPVVGPQSNDTFWVGFLTSIINLISLLPQAVATQLGDEACRIRFYKWQTEPFLKSVFNRFSFACIARQFEDTELSYEVLSGQKQSTNGQLKTQFNTLYTLVSKLSVDVKHNDDLKFLIQIIAATNVHAVVGFIRFLKAMQGMETIKIAYQFLVYAMPVMAVKSVVTPLRIEAQSQSNSMSSASIYISRLNIQKYLLEIIASLVLEYGQTNMYKSVVNLLTNVIRSVRFLSIFTQIDFNQLNSSLLPLLQQLVLYGGFNACEGLRSTARVVPNDVNSRTYSELASSSNFSQLLTYFKDSKQKYLITTYRVPLQYEVLIGELSEHDSGEGQQDTMQGNAAPICKLQQQVLDAFIDVLLFMRVPAEARRLILLKSLGVLRQYQKYPIGSFVERQLQPRVLLILAHLFEAQCNVQQYLEIIQAFSNVIATPDQFVQQTYGKLLYQFLRVAQKIILQAPQAKILLKTVSGQSRQYVNPVLTHIRYQGPFGVLPPICDYVNVFLKTGLYDCIQEMAFIDRCVGQLVNGQVPNLNAIDIDPLEHCCASFYKPDHFIETAVDLLSEGEPVFFKSIGATLERLYGINREFLRQNPIGCARIMHALLQKCLKLRPGDQAVLLQAHLGLLDLHRPLAFEVLCDYFGREKKLVFDVLLNVLFCRETPQGVDFSVDYVKQLHEMFLRFLLGMKAENFANVAGYMQVLYEQLYCIAVSFQANNTNWKLLQKTLAGDPAFLQSIFITALLLTTKQAMIIHSKPLAHFGTVECVASLLLAQGDLARAKELIRPIYTVDPYQYIDGAFELLQHFLKSAPVLSLENLCEQLQKMEVQSPSNIQGLRLVRALLIAASGNLEKLEEFLEPENYTELYGYIVTKAIGICTQITPTEAIKQLFLKLSTHKLDRQQDYLMQSLLQFLDLLQFDTAEKKTLATELCAILRLQDERKALMALLVLNKLCADTEDIVAAQLDLIILCTAYGLPEAFELLKRLTHSEAHDLRQITLVQDTRFVQKLLDFSYQNQEFRFRFAAFRALTYVATAKQLDKEPLLAKMMLIKPTNPDEIRQLMALAAEVAAL